MARLETVLSQLPGLISDRNDSRKFETAIRYVGDILFDAFQNRDGAKAKWLAGILCSASSTEDINARGAILSLFKDGYLDRYAHLPAWAEIGLAAGISPSKITPDSSAPAPPVAAKTIKLTRILNAPNLRVRKLADHQIEVGAKTIITESQSLPDSPGNDAFRQQAAQREIDRLRSITPISGAATSLDIVCVEATEHNPLVFAKNFESATQTARDSQYPCLAGFKPHFLVGLRSVEWANPVTRDRFVDHGLRLTAKAPSRLALRAMLELARAENWLNVSIQGSLRIQALAEATAIEIDRATATTRILPSANYGFAHNSTQKPGLRANPISSAKTARASTSVQSQARRSKRPRRRRRPVLVALGLMLLGASAFATTLVFENPVAHDLVVKLADKLPWARNELIADAKKKPLTLTNL
jgi:hypothetical protein